MSTHKISERGNGLPDTGERVYHAQDNTIYTVESIDSGILTKQFAANYVLATLEYECDAADLDDEEFNYLRTLCITEA